MSSFDKWQTEDRRLVILIILAKSEGYCCNEILMEQLLEQRGHVVSSDRLRTDLGWLQEQGLIKVKDIEDMQIATVNRRGIEVSQGRVEVAGVKRPLPGA